MTLAGMWDYFRKTAITERDVPVGSVQECEMKKAFMSGAVAAAMVWVKAVDFLPDEMVADLPYRFMDEFAEFIKLQVVRHPISTQNQTGN